VNRRILFFYHFLAFYLVVTPAAWCAGTIDSFVIGPVHVLSMQDGSIASNRAVIVRQGVIDRVTSFDEVQDSTGLRDGRNGFLVPGLAEMHAHIPSRSRGEQYTRDVLTLYLANGVTTVRGMLGEPWHLELREMLARQEWPGPRLITSGPSFNGRSVTSAKQAEDMVRDQVIAGYDFLKLHPGLKPDEFEAIATAAKKSGIPIAGHVSFEVGLDAALRHHQATIDHLDGYAEAMVPAESPLQGVAPEWFGVNLAAALDPGRAARLALATAQAEVWNVPTQSLLENLAGNQELEMLMGRPGMAYVSSGLKDRWASSVSQMRQHISPEERQRFLEVRRILIKELQNARAGLLLGSDAPQIMNVPGFSIHEELMLMVSSGLTPLQALQSGTISVSRFFGNESRGDIQSGFAADFILLQNNPLDDISFSPGILGVMRAGNWYDRDRLDAMLDDVKSRGL
jgi:imidazolonepropionase-like amidohydrolase